MTIPSKHIPSRTPVSTRGRLLTRLLDRIEHLIWESQDARLRAAGWEVTRLGRWRRGYRHPGRLARITATRQAAPARTRTPIGSRTLPPARRRGQPVRDAR